MTTGCDPGIYCPTGNVTRAQMAIFIAKAIVAPAGGAGHPADLRARSRHASPYSCDAAGPSRLFLRTSRPTDPFCKHVHYLYLKNIIGGCFAGHYCPNDDVSRGEMAKFLSNAFTLLLYGP